MSQDRTHIGIALVLGFCLVAPLGDAVAKLLGEAVPLGQVVAIRFALQAMVLIPLVWLGGRSWRMRGRVLALAFLRTLLHIAGIWAMFVALRYLPLADAVAIVFVMPFFMLILGHLVLGEEVGPRRLAACLAGFLGTLLIVQPSFLSVGWPALLPVLVALTFSVFMLITRLIAPVTDPVGLQAVNGVMAVVVMLPLFALGTLWPVAPLALMSPTPADWGLLLALGGLGTLAHLLMTWALRHAPSATVAPMQYLEIPFATLLGLLIFGDLPGPLALTGIAVTMAAGLYVILCERASALRRARQAAAPHPA